MTALVLLALSAFANPPDLSSDAVRGRCDVPRSGATPAVGADQTYAGSFTVAEDGSVRGTERRILFANSKWRTTTAPDGTTGHDCVVVWNIVGQRTGTTGCRDCTFGFTFQADIDYSASTCPMRIQADGNHFRGAYDVKENADGSIGVFFATSGNALGTGRKNEDGYGWISDHRCIWL